MRNQCKTLLKEYKLKCPPELDTDFRPIILENKFYLDMVRNCNESIQVSIAVEREQHKIEVYRTEIFPEGIGREEDNLKYIEGIIKSILWIKGGWKIQIAGPYYVYEYIKKTFSSNGTRKFDAWFMSKVYEKEFIVSFVDSSVITESNDKIELISKNLNGNRIGIDLGGTDIKVVSIMDGKIIFSEEIVWNPKEHSDFEYHYGEIRSAISKASKYLPSVDSIGVSSAGICINNELRISSLFSKVTFNGEINNIYTNMAKEFGNIPVTVNNDGDIAALTGAIQLNDTCILGIAMGTSQASGYIAMNGHILGWLNELCSVPIDYNVNAPVDWTGDSGCGSRYFSQEAVIRLALKAGIYIEENISAGEKLKMVQELMKKDDIRARKVFETIGTYLGYTIPYYAQFYNTKHLLLLGRVTSGKGGMIISDTAKKILNLEFPQLSENILIHLPEETERRFGQAITAASLPFV